MDPAGLLEGLDPDQRKAVTTDAAPLAILAPAGSGKTRVLTHRIARRVADGTADPRHVLVLTFTRRAAGELHRRLGRLGLRGRPTAGTFHGVAWSVLAQRWADHGRSRPDLLVDRARLLGPLVDALPGGSRRRPVRAEDIGAEIDWARARLVAPDRYPDEARRHGRRPPVPPEIVAQLAAAYQEEKRRRRVLDFDDLLAVCTSELRQDPAFAELMHWRFRHLFVDEFQDVNPLQFELLEAWRGGRPDLCVVGDPDQAIYGWNGADPTLLSRFAELVGGATVIRLARTYRSTPQVVATARAVLAAGPAEQGAPVVPVRPDGPPPRVLEFESEHAEAAGIARLVRERRPGRRWSACAVLVRTHAQVGPLLRALDAAGIPTRARTDRPLLDLPAVQAALRSTDAGAPLLELVEELEATMTAAAEDGHADPAGVRQLASLARELLAVTPAATVGAFRSWLLAGGADEAERADAVDVLTFHAAKGLEWPLVVVAGLEAGLVPHSSANTDEARAEEVRLLYVALSRAEDTLLVTWARTRGTGPRRERRPSPLLPTVLAGAEPEPAAPPPPELRTASPSAIPADPVLSALRRWRSAAALAADLPEDTVCTDDDIAALVAARPTTEEELAAVLGPLAARRLGPRVLPLLAGAEH